MQTRCSAEQLEFSCVERRRVVAAFDGGRVSWDAGALLLKRTDEAIELLDGLAERFVDRSLDVNRAGQIVGSFVDSGGQPIEG